MTERIDTGLTVQAEASVPQAGEIVPGDIESRQETGNEYIKAGGFEVKGCRGDADQANRTDSPRQGHGARQQRSTIEDMSGTGVDEPLPGYVVRIDGQPTRRNEQVDSLIDQFGRSFCNGLPVVGNDALMEGVATQLREL